MIISASRRTDIPAFYSRWFMNRIRAEFCTVANPFNPAQISNISLSPENVDLIVFWTRNPGPIIPYLKELNQRGYRFYFLYTLMNNPKLLDPKSPSVKHSLNIFKKLSDLIGPQKIIWRYDPIVLSNITDINFHKNNYENIAKSLRGYTQRCIISYLDIYRKIKGRLNKLSDNGFIFNECDDNIFDLSGFLAQIAAENNMQIQSCALKKDLKKFGIFPGKCIDDDYIKKVFGIDLDLKKDPSQRKECGCVSSKDIGMYNSCLYECQYCYATTSFEKAGINYRSHNPCASSLLKTDIK
ncbi:MAG: DUF1848 domain-containing protein [Proteobacteria bacterium]|nr:DUF1848 domain-containing protein [Pseudomonadota bacterium]